MDHPAGNERHIPCQSWGGQNGWSTALASQVPGSLFNSPPSSQQLGLGSSSGKTSFCELQTFHQSCMMNSSTLSTHHSALYKNPPSSSSRAMFVSPAFPSSSQNSSFVQQTPHTSSEPPTRNQRENLGPPSLPQTNQAQQSCISQQSPLIPSHNQYEGLFQPQLTNQGFLNRLQDLSASIPSQEQQQQQQQANSSQASSDGTNVGFSAAFGSAHSHSSFPQEQPQWMPLSSCRGAPNDSVPDAALLHDKEPSQEGSTAPPTRNATRRSELLHQRAQLLQQLAELDKVLEEAPPDDSSDEHPPHPETLPSVDDPSSIKLQEPQTSDSQQVQLPVLESELSPKNCEENETCSMPEDQMSESQSLQENVSDRSEDDCDPDYGPDGDGDSSSDDTSDSTDKRPSVREEKSSNSEPSLEGSELDKSATPVEGSELEKSAPPPKKLCAVNLKKHFETPVMPCVNSKKGRVRSKRNYCLFCSKPVVKMSRHLELTHSDRPEVAVAFQFPAKSKERKNIWIKLTNQGNFAHNKDVLKTGQGHVIVKHTPREIKQAGDFLHCRYCLGLFVRRNLHRHMKSCEVTEKKEKLFGRSLSWMIEATEGLNISEGLRNIVCKMRYNVVSQTIVEDEIMLQFGELLFSQLEKHDWSSQAAIRQKLRETARLVLEAQKITPLKKLEDFFLPTSFPHVVSAVNVLAGYNAETKSYTIPSLAIKLGCNLQKICGIVERNAVKRGDESLAESAQKFFSLYQKKWNKLVSGDALVSLREMKSNRAKMVPHVEDVRRLVLHMENVHLLAEKNLRASSSARNYSALVKIVMCRVTLLNRRRPVEISTLKLSDFLSQQKSNWNTGNEISMSNREKKLCQFFPRIIIQGSLGKMVPIILKPSFVSSIDLFVKAREACGISNENSLLFAHRHILTPFRIATCIQKYAHECEAKEPNLLTLRNIQKHHGKMVQLMNLDESEVDQIYGPNNQVRNLRQSSSSSSVQLDDVDRDSDGKTEKALYEKHPSTIPAQFPPCVSCISCHFTFLIVRTESRDTQNTGKHKWQEAEVQAVEKHMMRFIQKHKVPQKDDCIQCLTAEPEALRNRSWKGVKDYIRNRITSLKCAKKRSDEDFELTPDKNSEAAGLDTQDQPSGQTCTREQEDSESDSDEESQGTREQQAACHNESPSAQNKGRKKQNNKTASLKSGHLGRKGVQTKSKHKWKEAEIRAVEKHMMRFIKKHKVPQKDDCIQCLTAEPEALRARSWKGVKNYVRNRITSLKCAKKWDDEDSEELTPDKNSERHAAAAGQAARHNESPSAQNRGRKKQNNKTLPLKSVQLDRKGVQNKSKNKWKETEIRAVEKHMMHFIQGHQIPKKDDCVRCIAAEPEALRNCTWRRVKDYVRNRITSITRHSRR
ncbi:uncharacterized protein [Antennarius striatus]|uniref:uncharacterized protein isoform X2 n=1 Tax=Antennarius striatus TaxID=241820 RepID=UPI0035AFCD02